MDLSVITVTYQSQDYIDACILSVFAHTLNCTYEHIVVDNGSTDDTIPLIEKGYLKYVRLIKNSKNLGFSAANNQAVKEAKGRYILFLNPDNQICKGMLDDMITWMDRNPETGIAACKLVTFEEEPHPKLRPIHFPTPMNFLAYSLNFKWLKQFVFSHNSYHNFQDDLEQEVEHARGAFFLIRREIIDKLGFAFDPLYFLGMEDVDLNKEVQKLGYKTMYVPLVTCIDYLGRSYAAQTKPWKYFQIARSFKIYTRKWYPFHLLWLNLVIPIGFLLRLPEWGLKNTWQDWKQLRK